MSQNNWKMGKGAALSFADWMSGFVESHSLIPDESAGETGEARADELNAAVRSALDQLEERERLAVEGYHFMGRSPSEIAAEMSLSHRMLDRILRSAQKKMQSRLREFVAERFGIELERRSNCPICESPHRRKAEKVLAEKSDRETWRGVIRELRERFEIEVETPQSLIGHQKYHQI